MFCVTDTVLVSFWFVYFLDFRRRFLSLLSFKFREFGSVTALSLLEATNAGVKNVDEDGSKGPSVVDILILLTAHGVW